MTLLSSHTAAAQTLVEVAVVTLTLGYPLLLLCGAGGLPGLLTRGLVPGRGLGAGSDAMLGTWCWTSSLVAQVRPNSCESCNRQWISQ